MEELRPQIDGELMSVELDVEASDVSAYAVTTLEQHDIPQPIEQPPLLPQLPCEKTRLKQPPNEPPWLPQLDSQLLQLDAQVLQPPQLPLLPNQKALALHGKANTATIKAKR